MNNTNPTRPNLLQNAQQQRPLRLKWMRSGSILAAASAMIASGVPAHAQAGPGVRGPSAPSMQTRLPQGASEFRVPSQSQSQVRSPAQSPVRIIQVPGAGAPTVNVPTVNTPVVPPASTPITTSSNNQPLASGPTAPSPRAATSANGVSVNASAAFDDTRVRFTPGAAADTVELLGTSAIIDWTTFDTGTGSAVTFLGSERNLAFTSNNSDYTVLNRITTPGVESPVLINGNVTSTTSGGQTIGGAVWFSSAGGLIIGSEASFNIGSLLLTTSQLDPNDVVAGASAINFLGVSDPASSVTIQSGAQINALNNNSYVAVLAPRIVQNGTVNVNGSTAYVAAEEATLTIQNNLFDISVSVGSEDRDGIIHGGTTTGPSSTGITDEQAIYFVAVPKNDALTMLLGGEIGYAAAGSASVVNGNIILTTGDRVVRSERTERINGNDVEVSFNTLDTSVDGGAAGSIVLENLELTSDTQIFAEDTVGLRALSTLDDGDFDIIVGSATNQADLTIFGGSAVDISVSEVALIDVSGSLTVRAGDGAGNGGDINVDVDFADGFSSPDGGTLAVGNNLILDASGRGLDDIGNFRNNGGQGIGGDGVGGDINVTIGQLAGINVGGTFTVDTSASGGRGEVRHGSATAGSSTFTLNDGFVDIGGSLNFDARGREAGTLVFDGDALEGADATAGNVTVTLNGGGVDLGALDIRVGATATRGTDSSIAQSNDASAGSVLVDITGGAHFFGGVNINAVADAATSFDGISSENFRGQAGRGQAIVNVTNSDTLLDVFGSFDIDAGTIGSVSAPVGDAVAVSITNTGFNTGSGLTISGVLQINTSAEDGAPGVLSEAGGISVTADNGSVFADNFFFSADARHDFRDEADRRGTDFQGGTVNITATNDGSIFVNGFSFISADGSGTPDENDPGSGNGQGGSITVLADNGSISFGSFLSLDANGFTSVGENQNGQTGEGRGGTVNITVQGSTGRLNFNDLTAGTDGSFTFDGEVLETDFLGSGSTGIGGLTQFNVLGGTLTAQDITVSSDGEGGPGGEFPDGTTNLANGLQNTGTGGTGTGGEVVFNLDGGDATLVNLDITSNGVGGRGAPGSASDGTNAGDGGDSFGGRATFNAISGNLTVTDTLTVEATGNIGFSSGAFGGEGGFGRASIGGRGGDATGGTATFNLDGTATVDATNVVVSTQAFGGEGGDSRAESNGPADQGGGDGGNAVGGLAVFNDIAGNLTFSTLTVNASGLGGDGGRSRGDFSGSIPQGAGGFGGSGRGGSALISLNQDDTDPKEYSVISRGLGGDGADGAFAGDGGEGIGGTAELAVNDVFVEFEALTIDASATGGLPGTVTGDQLADGGRGGDATGGNARLLVSGPNADFQANSTISITAGATGAAGAIGYASNNDFAASGSGGAGGNAIGGSATIAVEDDALIAIDSFDFALNSDSVGGAGADGQDQLFGLNAGAGGRGGAATGGVVGITAARGGEVTIVNSFTSGPFALSSTGTGGAGGAGGNGTSTDTVGRGGIGGTGTGGSPLLNAVGGTINIADVTLLASGFGGSGGPNGQDINNPLDSVPSRGGDGSGGSPRIEAVEGSPGVINLGNVSIFANGTSGGGFGSTNSGGQVTIIDTSTSPGGNITVDDLVIDATGAEGTIGGLISILSNSGPITVNGILDLDVTGDITIAMEGDGQLLANPGGSIVNPATFNASGDITISHLNRAEGIATLDVGSNFTADSSAGTFDAFNDGSIAVGARAQITAEDVLYSTIESSLATSLTARGGSITGTTDGAIIASSVVDAITLDAARDVTFGTLISDTDGSIMVDAGGDITGGTADSFEIVNLSAPGTIAVDLINAGRSGTATGQINVNGGNLDIGSIDASGIVNLTSLTGDLSVDSLTTTTSADLGSANAINVGTGTVGAFTGMAVTDVTIGSLTTTGGFGDLRIVAGDTADVGTLNSNRLINVQATDIVGSDITALASIDLNAADTIDLGDIATTSSANITLGTDAGDITTGQITAAQGLVTVSAGGNGDIAGVVSSAGTSVVTIGDLIIGDVDAGGNGSFNVGGNLTAGNLFAGTTSPGLRVNTGGDADIQSATTNGILDLNITGALTGGDFVGQGAVGVLTIDAASVDVDLVESTNGTATVLAPGAVSIGNFVAELNSSITGASVNLDAGTVNRSLAVTSNTGDITGLGSIIVANSATFNSAANIAIGTLEAGSISLTSAGDLRFNGLTSPTAITLSAVNGTIGATTPGEGDIDSGVEVDLTAEAIDIGDVTSAGSITASTSVGDASFGALTAGTTIDITANANPLAESVTSGGNVTLTGASVGLDGGDVGGSLTLNALDGGITLAFDGDEQLVVADAALFTATGDMLVTHTNNTNEVISVDVGLGTLVDIGGSFTSEAGSILNSGIDLTMRVSGGIDAADLRAVEAILLESGGSITLNDASVIGPQNVSNNTGITLRAGLFDLGSGLIVFDNLANATITGDVTSYANIDIIAGGTVVFESGSNTAADNALIVNTGDDIIIEAVAQLSAANNPTTVFDPASPFDGGPNLILNAGGEQNLLSIPATPIASLVIDGTLNANDAAIILEGNAIEGLDSTLIAGSISADVRDAPDPGFSLSDDDGLLIGPCLQGIICLGDMDADNIIQIGIGSNNDAIQLFIEQAQITANDISIRTRNSIVMGTDGINTDINATGTFFAESITGDVDLRDTTIGADQILIAAAGSVTGSGFLTSDNDIGIDVGDSIILSGIVTAGELVAVEEVGGLIEGQYNVPGDFIVGLYSQGSSDINLVTGGSIDIGEAVSPNSISLSANDDAFLGTTNITGDLFIIGATAGYSQLDAGGEIVVETFGGSITADLEGSATAGAQVELIAAGDVDVGNLSAGSFVSVDAGGNALFGFVDAGAEVFVNAGGSVAGQDIFAGGDVTIDGGFIQLGDIDSPETVSITGSSIAVDQVTATNILLNSSSDILFNLLDSTNSITLEAIAGSIASNGGAGDIISDGDVVLEAMDIAIGDVTSLGSVTADASDGDATFGFVDADQDITIFATGTPTLAGVISGGNTSITGSVVALNSGDVGGDLSLVATSGDVTLDNTAAGGDLLVDAANTASLGNSSADGAIEASAFEIMFDTLAAGSTVTMISGTIIEGGALTAGGSVTMTAGSGGTPGSGGSGGPVTIGEPGEIVLGTLTAPDADLLANGGPVTVADAVIDGLLRAEGTAIDVMSSTDLTIEAIANDGDVDVFAARELEAVIANATGDVNLTSDNTDLIVNDAQGVNINLNAADRIEISGIADAENALVVTAFGLFDAVNGSALGETIDIFSTDVALGSDSIIGDASRTSSITFETFSDMTIGGGASDDLPYQIDNFELTRISSGGDLNFTAFADGSTPNALIILDTLDLRAGFGFGNSNQNFAQTGSLNFTAQGDIEVIGNVNVAGALSDTSITFDADNLVRIDSANGGIFVLDTDGLISGDLSIFATDFLAVTDQALNDIDAGLSLEDIDARLANNDGVDRPDGVIRADALTIQTTASDVFIQNTVAGTEFDERRGFEVNSLSISTGGSTAQPIVINGVVAGQTGVGAIAVTTIGATPAAASTINGCLIANPASCTTTVTPPPPPPLPGPTPPPAPPPPPSQETEQTNEVETRDLIDDGLSPPDVQPEGPLDGGLINLTPEASFGDDPLIDDPVTGAGNEDFWVDEEEPCEEGEDCDT
ncbi:beta strand repeat-containing protein [Erythrobacter longus]|nr:hypothetical protein [Erythrobacter longus]